MKPYKLTYNDRNGNQQAVIFWKHSRKNAEELQTETIGKEGTKCSELFEGEQINPFCNMAWELRRLKKLGEPVRPLDWYNFNFIRKTFGYEGEK